MIPSESDREPSATWRSWSVRNALGAYAVSWLAIAGVTRFAQQDASMRAVARGGGALIIDATWLLLLLPLYRAGRLRLSDLGLQRIPDAAGLALAVLALIVAAIFDGLWRAGFGHQGIGNPFDQVAGRAPATIALAGAAAFLSPFAEEIFFRGFLYRALRNQLPVWPAAILVGAMFAAIHTEYALGTIPQLMFYGVLTCLVYERTGSLYPTIGMDLFLDLGGFERALTGRIVLTVVGLTLSAGLLLFLRATGVGVDARDVTNE